WQLAGAAAGTVLVFVDADVVLAPDAVAGAVSLMRNDGLAFVSPYPRQLAGSWLERLVQPLLQWSWLAFLPLRVAQRSGRPALALVRSGARGGFADGHDIAGCRMYDGARSVTDGYAKSLWCAFGSPVGAVAVTLLVAALGLLPWALVAFTPVAWPAALGGPAS